MNPPAQSITFSISPDDPLGILEGVLASARRGGLALAALNVHSVARGLDVQLLVRACELERIDLFAARLGNIFGVAEIRRDDLLSVFFTPASSNETGQGLNT